MKGALRGSQAETPAGLAIDRARIAVSEIELEGGQDDEREASMGDAVIEVVLGGDPTTVAVDAVESGTYHTLGIELAQRDLEGAKSSILVEGTINGQRFTFRSGIEPEVEFRLAPEVDVPAKGSASAGISFDVSAWFQDGEGTLLDPTDAANQGAIERAVMASMAVNAEIESEEDGNDD